MLSGLYATYLRVFYGLGASTNLNDQFPWGIWIGFDILCGVGLAAGGFTIVAIVHIFNIERYKPILRPTILTAFLGYVLVVVALMFDLGRPDRIWHPMVMWNPHSVMFEVAWCVMLYNTVLALEFAPAVCERFGWHTTNKWIKAISVPLVILGVVLSTLHQSSLGSLYLSVPSKLYALWYTPFLPVFFYISAICVGLAMCIFEARHSAKAFHREMHMDLMNNIARILAVLLSFYLVLRFHDLRHREVLDLLFVPRMETYLFWLEIGLMAVGAFCLYFRRIRANADLLYVCALFVIFGFLTNRLNISLTGMEAASGTHYIPKWTEIAVTLSVVAAGFAIFRFAAQYLPVFDEPHEEEVEADVEPQELERLVLTR
ncbi:MAG: Ni/Fe-hydrogenase cytochrome b subunit [Acidobacteria bacterium]|nr:Ni/Fe-hydrogenase cytochrome b subunit [Acidobacteriota bacterium]